MKYAFTKINIESPFPTTQCGHSCQVEKLFTYHDHLYARVAGLKDEENWIIHLSLDLLAFDQQHRDMLEEELQKYYSCPDLHVITSTTHTHYANSVRDPEYVAYLYELLVNEIKNMSYREVNDVTTSYQRLHTTAIGKSRISGYETDNEYLALIRFYEGEHNFLTFVYYNCHPTILQANVPFFSAEYPGYVLKKLEDEYDDCDFSFLQGAAGDISSRFVRNGQNYEDVMELGNNLLIDITSLYEKKVNRVPLKLVYRAFPVEFEHEFTPIDLSKIRQNLSEREKETIRLGQIERAKLEKKNNQIFGQPNEKINIVALALGSVELIFFPNEIFSHYLNYLDLDKKLLVSYSNGYGPYVLPLDFEYITYEMFTDTLSVETKKRIIAILKEI
ncbi:MAG: hypothetical protein IKI61_05480 [Erysipelotrichaceae bacterium]|nr:hypothetical protein [Erysipelotrichaceae bacterium]